MPDVGAGGYEEGLAGLIHCMLVWEEGRRGGDRERGRILTAMDMRQMEHSLEFTEAVSESRVDVVDASFLTFWRASSCLCVFLL